MKNNFYGTMVLSRIVLSTVTFFSSFVGNCYGYGLSHPFSTLYSSGFPPDSPFFEVKSGYWSYACLFDIKCKEYERTAVNNFGYGSELYYHTCEYFDGKTPMPDKPVRCRRVLQPAEFNVPSPPIAPTDKFLYTNKGEDLKVLCAECQEFPLDQQGFTGLFYTVCNCHENCWSIDVLEAEKKLLRGIYEYPCEAGNATCFCRLYRLDAGWSSEELNCVPPIYTCTAHREFLP